jgi:Pectate lyase superfamily protein
MTLSWSVPAEDRINLLNYAPSGKALARDGAEDVSQAMADAISAANAITEKGLPACVYVPPGVYRISKAPPAFVRAGCIVGDGPSQSIIKIDPKFEGDLFAWSEAWVVTTPGPTVIGLRIVGSKSAANIQNALVFYDRNDQVFIDNLDVIDLHGRALYSGVTKKVPQAYMRESHLRSLRFFDDGGPGIPVVEFNSQGTGETDATNEIRMSQVDIYGARGPSLVIRNNGSGVVRDITVDALRIEGSEDGTTGGDLLTIGDPVMTGGVNNITLTALELIDPAKGYAALRLTAPFGVAAPYQIYAQGAIGGGVPRGQGLRIDAGRQSTFHLSGIHTLDTNVVIGRGVSWIILDGDGQESSWSYLIDPTSAAAIHVPVLRSGNPSTFGTPK